jgi:predicted nucleic acid-binding protein
MRYVVLDTDVASRAIKGQLGDPMAARLTGTAWCVTFVTVGELWQWATTRSWGPRTREQLEQWLGRVVILHSDDATSRAWGRISAAGTSAASQRQLDRGLLPGAPVRPGHL